MSGPRPGERALAALLVTERRGPRRSATFAAWLTLRAIVDRGRGPPALDRNQAQRFEQIRRRLRSLSAPDALRLASASILSGLETETPDYVAAINTLAKSLRECGISPAADAVEEALDAGIEPTDHPTLG